MKELFLVLVLASLDSFAGYVAESKINTCYRVDYSSPSDCTTKELEACYRLPDDSGSCGVYKFKDLYRGPRKSVDECLGIESCRLLLASKACLNNQSPFISDDYKFVYCMDKSGKEIAVDQDLKTRRDLEVLDSQLYEKEIAEMEAEINKGKRVVALFKVLNNKKNLTKSQRKQQLGNASIKAIMEALGAGSLPIAAELIQNYVPDGLLVTEQDKISLLKELQN